MFLEFYTRLQLTKRHLSALSTRHPAGVLLWGQEADMEAREEQAWSHLQWPAEEEGNSCKGRIMGTGICQMHTVEPLRQ